MHGNSTQVAGAVHWLVEDPEHARASNFPGQRDRRAKPTYRPASELPSRGTTRSHRFLAGIGNPARA